MGVVSYVKEEIQDFFVAKHTIKRSGGPFLVDFFSS